MTIEVANEKVGEIRRRCADNYDCVDEASRNGVMFHDLIFLLNIAHEWLAEHEGECLVVDLGPEGGVQ